MSTSRLLLPLPLVALLLTGCGVDPAAERRELVGGITESANAGDEEGVRTHVDLLVQLLERQVEDGEIAADEAEQLRALATKVRTGADLLDDELQARLKAEADAELARKERDEAQKRLEEERRKAEEERKEDEGKGKGGDGGKDEKDD